MVRVWVVQTGAWLRKIESHKGPVVSVGTSLHGTKVVSGPRDGTYRIWDAQSGACLGELYGQPPIRSAGFSPDGTQIFSTALVEGTVQIWDAASHVCLGRFRNWMFEVEEVAISPDGTLVLAQLSNGVERETRIWHIQSSIV